MTGQRRLLPSTGMLARLALRNAKRHRAQAIAAAAAVAVGVTVLTASLLAGQAAQAGITQVGFDLLDEVDELVRTEGDFLFPEEAADRFAREVERRDGSLAVSPALVHTALAGTPEGLSEPDTLLIGYPPDERGFGRFRSLSGADRITERGALVNQELAEALDLQVGDTVELRYAPPVEPLVPTVRDLRGNATGARPGGPLPGLALPADPTAETFPIEVEPGATRIVAVLLWDPAANATDLDLSLEAPSGERFSNPNGSTTDPDVPALLEAPATAGTWTATVTGKAAANEPFRLLVITLRPAFDLEELRQARQDLQELGPLGEQLLEARGTRTAAIPVAGVVSGEGKGGLFASPGLVLPLDRVQELVGRPGEVNLVRISNPGGPREGLDHTREAMAALWPALNATKAAHPDQPSVQALQVEPSKQEFVAGAERAGKQFTQFLATLSSFTIIAGILLVVNLFQMLAEERREELSVMRALGLERRHLVATTTMEGTLYALPGAPIGAVLGLGLAWALIGLINDLVVSQDALPIPFIVDPWTLLWAAVLGLAFTIVAVAVTGWRLSRLDIASGLKGLPDPETNPVRRWFPPLLLGAGLLLTPLFWPTGLYTLVILGPSMALYGAALLLAQRAGWEAHRGHFLGALLVLPYLLWSIVAFQDIPTSEVPLVAPLRGTLMVLAGVVLIINAPGLARGLKALGRRMGSLAPATMVALAYPTRRRVRTGLTASMFALVLLVLAVFSSFFNVFQVDPAREAGGYDLYAETNLPIDDLDQWARANLDQRPESLDRVRLVDDLSVVRVFGGDVVTIDGQRPNYDGPPVDWFYGIDEDFADHNRYRLVSRLDRFETDQAAYRAVADGGGYAVVSRLYDVDHAGRLGQVQGGERLQVSLVSGTVNVTVVGAQEQRYLGGIFLDRATVEELFPTHGRAFLMRVEPGQDPVEVAQALERDFAELGLDAESIEAEAVELQQLSARFFTVLQVFLGLGLVIGVASLGIVTAKSALEREHELGVLRAIGLDRRHVTWSLVSESLLTAMLGIVPGIAVGVAVAYASWLAFFQSAGVPFTIPWTSIAVLSGVSLLAGLLSTLGPARRAARADVAEAVRVRL